jgi:type I restriction enzyme S subunit
MNSSPKGAAQGWRIAKISDFAKTTSGGTPSRANPEFYTGNIPWIKSGDLNDGNVSEATEFITEEALKNSSAKLFPAGTLMIALYGATIGKLGILTIDAATNQAVCGIFVPEGVETKYLFYFLLQHRPELIKQGAGGAQPNISQGIIRDIEVPLPPLSEQRRIVARIEELFSRLDAGVAALRHAKAQLQRYRQSVLAAAVTGQLTQAWREQHPETERPKRTAELFGTPLPESWECSSLKLVVSEGPRNGFSPICGTEPSGSKVLKLSATSSGRMLLNEKTTKFSVSPVAPGSHAWLQPDDVLIQRANSLELLGSTAIYEGSKDEYVYPDLMMRVRVSEPTTRKLLVIYLNCLPARNYFQRNATGVAGNMPKINGAMVKALPVPIPPLAEQHQIVAEVEARTTAIDHLETELDRQIARSTRLRQSTLATAFSGKL